MSRGKSASVCLAASVTLSMAAALIGPTRVVAEDDAKKKEAELLTGIRQLTFEGRRAGEGYFSRDGKELVFQSEREPGNPFFQIYTMDLEIGDVERVSPGTGKTTCAWFHPDGRRVLYASTQDDPGAKAKQEAELKLRAEGKQRRYAWDYDEHFELYYYDRSDKNYTRLTAARGYDAEASMSPDGKWIVFSSNRRAYDGSMNEHEAKRFEIDPAVMLDLYIMRSDGSDVRRLTDVLGYDGGPFFSPDGKRICWRRFDVEGAKAEIMTMGRDGKDVRQLTKLDALSWAPYYHPSGKYLIFATNRHGFANFELYLVDVDGKHEPVRVTYVEKFDGLPVFSPDGTRLAWTSNRTADKTSQIFIATWNHKRALQLLGLSGGGVDVSQAEDAAERSKAATSSDISSEDIMRHVAYLCRDELAGRRTGTRGEKLATAYVAAYFNHLGLKPCGETDTYFQEFSFTAGVSLGEKNRLQWKGKSYRVDDDWRPIAFSATGKPAPAPLVFAGYGIVSPGESVRDGYDAYGPLNVKDQWVVVFRFLPEDISPEQRQKLARYSNLRSKAMVARDKGARGLIVVTGPRAAAKDRLVPLQLDGSLGGTSIPVISVADDVAAEWFRAAGKSIEEVQKSLDTGKIVPGFTLSDAKLECEIDIRKEHRTGRNVLACLEADGNTEEAIIIGAHVDHLGRGPSSSSLARDDERDRIHFGADDNASGVAAVLEIAEYLVAMKKAGKLRNRRDIIFAAWSGEEMGLIGSHHFVEQWKAAHERKRPAGLSTGVTRKLAKATTKDIAAALNLDMVGRLRDKLILQGVGSSSIWRKEIERRNAPIGLPISIQEDGFIPTDGASFYTVGIPMLSAFTGAHEEYHTPRDTPQTLNADGAAKVARLFSLITRGVAMLDATPEFIASTKKGPGRRTSARRAYLGTIPAYGEEGVKGVKLSGVSKHGPAAKAGVQGGDVIVELAGKKVENIYDFVYALEALKVGKATKIVVMRNGKRVAIEVVPESRE